LRPKVNGYIENNKYNQIVAIKDVISKLKSKKKQDLFVNNGFLMKNVLSRGFDESVDYVRNNSKGSLKNIHSFNSSNNINLPNEQYKRVRKYDNQKEKS